MRRPDAPVRDPLRRAAAFMLSAWALLTVAVHFPPLDATAAPYADLTGRLGAAAFYVTETGSFHHLPWLAGALILLLAGRPELTLERRLTEALALASAFVLTLGMGLYLTELVVKRQFAVPRPNIQLLARTPSLATPGDTVLGETAESFYRRDRRSRSEVLRARSSPRAGCFEEVPVHELVCGHWIEVVGFSFPSGHSLSATFFATFFLALGLRALTGRRLWPFYLLVPWSILVCATRGALRVHIPIDISAGALLGIALGAATFLLVRKAMRLDARQASYNQPP